MEGPRCTLVAATECCDVAMAKLLLKYGANRAAREKQASTPVEAAKAAGKFELVPVLGNR